MNNDTNKNLLNIISRPHMSTFKLSKVIGVSIVVLANYLAGMPVSSDQEAKLVAYVEGVI